MCTEGRELEEKEEEKGMGVMTVDIAAGGGYCCTALTRLNYMCL